MLRGEHLLQNGSQLDLPQNAPGLDVGQDLFQVPHPGGQVLHLPQALVDLLQPLGHQLEGVAELAVQGLLELFVHRLANGIQLLPVALAHAVEPLGESAAQLVQLLLGLHGLLGLAGLKGRQGALHGLDEHLLPGGERSVALGGRGRLLAQLGQLLGHGLLPLPLFAEDRGQHNGGDCRQRGHPRRDEIDLHSLWYLSKQGAAGQPAAPHGIFQAMLSAAAECS